MTAINPARLRIQCAELAGSFDDPPQFCASLHDLLGFYSARVRQTSLSKTPLTLQTYQVPSPVFKTLELELEGSIKDKTDSALDLIDALWDQDWLEFRQLAVIILGLIPCQASPPAFDRIRDWLQESTVEDLRLLIMTRGLETCSQEAPGQTHAFIRTLSQSELERERQAALFGLQRLADDRGFEDFPAIFKILRDILSREENIHLKEIKYLIRSLLNRSDQETAYFLTRQLAIGHKPRLNRVIRGVLEDFSLESQSMLRTSLETYPPERSG